MSSSNQSDPRIIDVAVCLNEEFIVGFVVTIRSLLQNLKSGFKPNVFLIHRQLPVQTIEEISNFLFENGIQYNWIEINTDELHGLITVGHLDLETYFRLLLPKLIPPCISKVLYLDCDLLVTDDVSELWELPIKGKKIAISEHWNAGVMIMNLDEWRGTNFGSELISFVRTHPEKCPLADNSAIIENTSKEEATVFDARWNLASTGQSPHKGIVHFVGHPKPWHYNYGSKTIQSLFLQQLSCTNWSKWTPARPRLSKRIVAKINSAKPVQTFSRYLGKKTWGVRLKSVIKRLASSK